MHTQHSLDGLGVVVRIAKASKNETRISDADYTDKTVYSLIELEFMPLLSDL